MSLNVALYYKTPRLHYLSLCVAGDQQYAQLDKSLNQYTSLRTQPDGSSVYVMNAQQTILDQPTAAASQSLLDSTQFTADDALNNQLGSEIQSADVSTTNQLLEPTTSVSANQEIYQTADGIQYVMDSTANTVDNLDTNILQQPQNDEQLIKQEDGGEPPRKKQKQVYLVQTDTGYVMVDDTKILEQMGLKVPEPQPEVKTEDTVIEQGALKIEEPMQEQSSMEGFSTDYQQGTYDDPNTMDSSLGMVQTGQEMGMESNLPDQQGYQQLEQPLEQPQSDSFAEQYVLQTPSKEQTASEAMVMSEGMTIATTASEFIGHTADTISASAAQEQQQTASSSSWLDTLADAAAASTPKTNTTSIAATPKSLATTLGGSLATTPGSTATTPGSTAPTPGSTTSTGSTGKKTKYIISYGGKKYVCVVDNSDKAKKSSDPNAQAEGLKNLLKGALAKTTPKTMMAKTTASSAKTLPAKTTITLPKKTPTTQTTVTTQPVKQAQQTILKTPGGVTKRYTSLFNSPLSGIKSPAHGEGTSAAEQTVASVSAPDTPVVPDTVATPTAAVSTVSTPASTATSTPGKSATDKSRTKYVIMKKGDKYLLVPQAAAKTIGAKTATPATKSTLANLKSSLIATPKTGRGVKLSTGGGTGMETLVVPSLKVNAPKATSTPISTTLRTGTKRKYTTLLDTPTAKSQASTSVMPGQSLLLSTSSAATSTAVSASPASTAGGTSAASSGSGSTMYLITDPMTGKYTLTYQVPKGAQAASQAASQASTSETTTLPTKINQTDSMINLYMSDSQTESQASMDLQAQNLGGADMPSTLFPPTSDTLTDSQQSLDSQTYITDTQSTGYSTENVTDSSQFITEGTESAVSQGTEVYGTDTATSQAGTTIQYVTDTGETVTSGQNYITQYVTESGEILDPSQFEGQQHNDPNSAGQILQYTDPNTGEMFQQYTDPNTGELMQQQITDPNTGNVLQQQITDPTTGEIQYTDTNTEHILQQQVADQNTDPSTGEILQQDVPDTKTEQFTDQNTTEQQFSEETPQVKEEIKQESTDEIANQDTPALTDTTQPQQQYFTDEHGNQFLITTTGGDQQQQQQEGVQYQFVDDQGNPVQYTYSDQTAVTGTETIVADPNAAATDSTSAISTDANQSNVHMFVQDGVTYYYQAGDGYATAAADDGQQYIVQEGAAAGDQGQDSSATLGENEVS